ncbi:hypothetical protein H5410_001690 [Solanum commersonii]|uniref:Uncharacterized protein n=1 Tax=Solanum commersonii TaxID=4109 RepID=A0A9J6AZH5_SOLCO|nr:hypothetical protein H5410_001690 [Solanum commersonii]
MGLWHSIHANAKDAAEKNGTLLCSLDAESRDSNNRSPLMPLRRRFFLSSLGQSTSGHGGSSVSMSLVNGKKDTTTLPLCRPLATTRWSHCD